MIRFKRPFRDRVPAVITVLVAAGLSIIWLGTEVWPLTLMGVIFGEVFVLVEGPAG